MQMNYDYPKYEDLTDSQKLLWWFDEYLRYDLVISFLPYTYETSEYQHLAFLVERHTTYRYAWASDYSFYLWNLCNTTDIIGNQYLNQVGAYNLHYKDVTVTIPPSDSETIVTYLADEIHHVSSLGRLEYIIDAILGGNDDADDVWRLTKAQTNYSCYTKHCRILPSSTKPQTIKLANVATYSVVVTSANDITDVFPAYLLYDNITEWESRLIPMEYTNPKILEFADKQRVYFSRIYIDADPYFFPSDPPVEPQSGLFVPKEYYGGGTINELFPSEELVSSHLFYARIPDTVFDGKFKAEVDALPPDDLHYGIVVDTNDILTLLVNNNTYIDYPKDFLTLPQVGSFRSETNIVVYTIRYQFTGETTSDLFFTYKCFNKIEEETTNGVVTFTRVTDHGCWTIDMTQYNQTVFRQEARYTIFYGNSPLKNFPEVYITKTLEQAVTIPSPEEANAKILELLETGEYVMGIEIKIDEIHACLGAGEAAYYDDNGSQKPVVMNIARKLDSLCKWEGLNVKFNGKQGTHQDTRYFPSGSTIPGGWYFDKIGLNAGWEDSGNKAKTADNVSIDDQRVGVAYEVRSNLLVKQEGTQAITNGGIIACNNKIQFLEAINDDLDKALDWQEIGTGIINLRDQTFVFEGLLDILQEILFQVTETNANSDEAKIAIGVTQQIVKETMKIIGLPVGIKTFDYELQEDYETDPKKIQTQNNSIPVPYPASLVGAPTLTDLLIGIMGNLSIQNTGKLSLKNKKKEELINKFKS